MKKTLLLAILFLMSFALSGCSWFTTVPATTTTETVTTTSSSETTTTTVSGTTTTSSSGTTATTSSGTTTTTTASTTASSRQTVEIYAVNDLHGTAYSSFDTFSRMAAYLKNRQAVSPNTLILASGDMFQGTALSNYYRGRPIVEILNAAGFDAFTLGNHEFDWGIDQIAVYRDGNPDNGELAGPVLAANIVNKTTHEPMSWTQPYFVYETNGLRIGVIGVIGDVINSISASRVADYEFTDALAAVAQYAPILHVQEDCDLVVVSMHGYSSSVNLSIAGLSGDSQVDAVLNGHTHQNQYEVIPDETAAGMPCVQVSGNESSGSLLAKIVLVYDTSLSRVVTATPSLIGEISLGSSDPVADDIIEEYSTDPAYVAFISEVLATTTVSLNRYSDELQKWGASVVRDYAGVDFGMINAGGFRVSLSSGEQTMGDLVVLYPFDNYIKTCELTGAQLTSFYLSVLQHGYDVVWDDSVSYADGVLSKDGVPVNLAAYYTVGAVDYIFDKTNYAFLSGRNVTTTELLMRDLLAADLRNTDGFFNPANGTSYGQ